MPLLQIRNAHLYCEIQVDAYATFFQCRYGEPLEISSNVRIALRSDSLEVVCHTHSLMLGLNGGVQGRPLHATVGLPDR